MNTNEISSNKTQINRAPLQLPERIQEIQQQRAALTAQKKAYSVKAGRARSSTLLGSRQNRQYLSMVAPGTPGAQLRQNFLQSFSIQSDYQPQVQPTKTTGNSQVKATLDKIVASERDFTNRVQARQRLVTQRISQTTRASQTLLRNNYNQAKRQNLLPLFFKKFRNALFQNTDRVMQLCTFNRRINASFASLFLIGSATFYTQLHRFNKADSNLADGTSAQNEGTLSRSFISYLTQAMQTSVMKNVISVLDSRPVSNEWQGWLNHAFQQTQTHNALLFLLVNGIQDQRFIDKSIVYGLDLLDVSFRSKEVLDSSLQMVNECLVKEQRVVDEAVQLCKWIATHDNIKELSSELMCRVHFRSDLCEVMTWQTACAGYDATMTDECRQCAFDEGFKAVGTDKFVDGAYSSAVNKTLANVLTLGLYGYFTDPELELNASLQQEAANQETNQ